ncbi:MAG: PQQ-dependent sugar dehydrogenase [Polyangiaceae bacterium]|nr:PQQ-dependent sugar dehydrogenase [Polyangiaceae bacterium]
METDCHPLTVERSAFQQGAGRITTAQYCWFCLPLFIAVIYMLSACSAPEEKDDKDASSEALPTEAAHSEVTDSAPSEPETETVRVLPIDNSDSTEPHSNQIDRSDTPPQADDTEHSDTSETTAVTPEYAWLVRTEFGGYHEDCPLGADYEYAGHDSGAGEESAGDGVLGEGEVEETRMVCRLAPPDEKMATTGLTLLPENNTCRPPRGSSQVQGVDLKLAFEGVSFPPNPACLEGMNDADCSNAFRPMGFSPHHESGLLYLVEQNGRILSFDPTLETTTATVQLDIRSKVAFFYEPGLLNITFDPAHPEHAYLYYMSCVSQALGVPPPVDGCTFGTAENVFGVVSRFTLDGDGELLADSERVILEIEHAKTEHNGAGAHFGPDGMLYIAQGDGGEFPALYPQDPNSLLGKILRLDVHDEVGEPLEGDTAYRIPSDNPFVGDDSMRDEVFALGFRNPWRFSFDPERTHRGLPTIWLGDVGLVTYEEVNWVEAGKNYGWPIMEGPACRPGEGGLSYEVTVTNDSSCNEDSSLTPPVHAYRQSSGVSVTGGVVYQGDAIPFLVGQYLYADFSVGMIYALDRTRPDLRKTWLYDASLLIPSFSTDLDDEVYVFDWWSGDIHKIVPSESAPARPATRLSETGCVNPEAPLEPAPGAFRYDVNVPFFSEPEIKKERWAYLAPSSVVTEYDDSGNLILQPGSVLMKHFDYQGRRIETRIFYLFDDSQWVGFSYEWLEDESDAILLDSGKDVQIDELLWRYPDRGECMHCHTIPAGRTLGFQLKQLNRIRYFPELDVWANQIDTLRSLGRLDRVEPIDRDQPLGAPGNAVIVESPGSDLHAKFPEMDDVEAPLKERVGAYLESNCSHCHRPAGGGRGDIDLRSESFLEICDRISMTAVYDAENSLLVTPGSPEDSIIYRRITESELPYRMHPYARGPDEKGSALIKEWIEKDAAQDCTP